MFKFVTAKMTQQWCETLYPHFVTKEEWSVGHLALRISTFWIIEFDLYLRKLHVLPLRHRLIFKREYFIESMGGNSLKNLTCLS